jgi:hypothetical protein
MADEKPAVELAFDEMAAIVREKDESKLTFDKYLAELRKVAAEAGGITESGIKRAFDRIGELP